MVDWTKAMLLSRRHTFHKYQSGFRQVKSTDDHLFRLSQSVIECFNRREHVVGKSKKLLIMFSTMDSGMKFLCLTFPPN